MQEIWEGYEEAEDSVLANQNAASCDDNCYGENANGDDVVSSALGVKPRRSRKQKSPRRKNPVPLKIPRYEEPEPAPILAEDDGEEEYVLTTIAPEQGLPPLAQPSEDRLRCEQEASQMVHDANIALGDRAVKSPKLNDMVANLTALMLQIKTLAKSDMNSYGFKSLNDSLEEIKKKIDPANLGCFQNNVEVHVAHIQSGMSQMGNLHAFAEKNIQY